MGKLRCLVLVAVAGSTLLLLLHTEPARADDAPPPTPVTTSSNPGTSLEAPLDGGASEDWKTSKQEGIPAHAVAKELTHQLTLGDDFLIKRTGELGERLVWNIVVNGRVGLRRNASGELQYHYYRNFPGSRIHVYLSGVSNGSYVRVSNIVSYDVPEKREHLDEEKRSRQEVRVRRSVPWIEWLQRRLVEIQGSEEQPAAR